MLGMTAGTATIATLPTVLAAAPAGSRRRFLGHVPGKVRLGMSTPGSLTAAPGFCRGISLQRSFFDWADGAREDATVAQDHAAGRIPWISFKPASSARGGWAAIAAGHHDQALRARARRYAAYKKVTWVTFHHEPTNDTAGTGAEWAAAYLRVRSVIRDEVGTTKVRFAPIIGDWAFNPQNRDANAGKFLLPEVLEHAAFLGVDCYENSSREGYEIRLGRIADWLDKRGFPRTMLAVGETGCTNYYGVVGAAEWWRQQWAWCERNTDRIAAVSYFNSTRNSRSGVFWPLNESRAKADAYRSSGRSTRVAPSLR
jgi:hypothetical protein